MPESPADVKLVGNAMADAMREISCLRTSKAIDIRGNIKVSGSINARLPFADAPASRLGRDQR
jgi:hypothetical protein